MFTRRTFANGEEIRKVYLLHVLNHVLKTHSRILKNSAKLALAAKEGREIEYVLYNSTKRLPLSCANLYAWFVAEVGPLTDGFIFVLHVHLWYQAAVPIGAMLSRQQ